MTEDEGTAATLRRAFDESFAGVPEVEHDDVQSFLGVGIHGASFAIRMREIAGIVTGRKVIPLPTSVDSFAGLTTHRGVLVPIYDLGVLLGHGSSTCSWIAFAKVRDALLGFGFSLT
jgi:chemotaxis signal transduction protein